MEPNQPIFDVILPVAPKDVANLELCIQKIQENICPEKIVVIANKLVKDSIPFSCQVEFCDEDQLMKNLTMDQVKKIILDITGSETRSNWYFQQFLKMAYAYQCPHDYYLVWDSDTIPLNNIRFWRDNNGEEQCLFSMYHHIHTPYFDTLNTLFNGKVKRLTKESFIVEHMMINRKIMRELIHDIEVNDQLHGTCFFEKILHAIHINDISYAGFSEFETYGNYVLNYYPNAYAVRNLRTYRQGAMVIDYSQINNHVLNWIAKDYDTISFEEHGYNRVFGFLRKKGAFFVRRRIISFKSYQYIFSVLENFAVLRHSQYSAFKKFVMFFKCFSGKQLKETVSKDCHPALDAGSPEK